MVLKGFLPASSAEYEVPAPFSYSAVITMIDYKLRRRHAGVRHRQDLEQGAGWSDAAGSWMTSRWHLHAGRISLLST
jgi:hypothetical protein